MYHINLQIRLEVQSYKNGYIIKKINKIFLYKKLQDT